MTALDYFLKANLYGLLFAGCYWLLLRRHTFFGLNRAYLLASAVGSLLLPLASLPSQTTETLPVPVGVIVLPMTAIATTTNETVLPQATRTMPAQSPYSPDWVQLGLTAYGLIAMLLLARLLVRLGRLWWQIRRSPRQVREGFVLVQPGEAETPTFSFFEYVVLNPADADNELVLRHELVHVRQYHSADVLTLAILRAVFWACPALRFIDRMLRQVHEFLADHAADQPTDYARFLVAYAFGAQTDTLTNGFFKPSLLKQRIQMLYQKSTTRWALGKYALVLPLVFGLLAMTTARDELSTAISRATDEPIIVSGRVTGSANGKPLAGAIVMIAQTGKGTPTDAKGHFVLHNVPKTALLSISFTGYTLMVVPVGGQTTMSISLAPAEPNELPAMGATAMYKAIKPNPAMPIRTPPSSETIDGEVYTAVEETAVFPTGIPGLMQFVAHTLRYPAKAKAAGIEGTVLVQFIVTPNGTIGAATIKKGFDFDCNAEALRVVRKLPKWIPGKQNGKAVATQFVLPIQFVLDKKDNNRTGQVQATEPVKPAISEGIVSRNGFYSFSNEAVRHSDSIPVSHSSVTIRGNGLLGQLGEKPIYVVDSMQVDSDFMSGMDVKTIESITVLKEPSARAAYGEKGRNGVVIITTKKK